MTLGVGDHVAKLERHYDPETKQTTIGPDLAQNEAYHEFEVVDLTDCNQGSPEGFKPTLRLVK